MDREQHGRAVYEVDWTGQGYEQLAQQMRDFLALKRQVDAEIKRGFTRGPAPSGLVGAQGQPLISAGRQADFAQQQQAQAQERAHQQQQRAERQQQLQEDRAARAEETRYRQAERQAAREDRNDERSHNQFVPNVFGAFQDTSGLKTDEDWKQYHQAIQSRYQNALKNNEQLNQADKQLLSRANAIARGVAPTPEGHGGGLLNRLTNMAGWMPFLPQEVYMGQMALGEMGLGLGPVGVAAGLGIGALGAGALGVFNTTASELQMQRLLAGVVGGGAGTMVTPADQALADNLTQMGAGFGLSRQDMFNLIPTAASFNFGTRGDLQGIVQGGLVRASEGQLSNQQGVALQALVASRTAGGDVAETNRQFALLNQAIKDTGANIHTVYSDILQDGAALRMGTNLAQFAAVDAALAGTGLTAMDVIGGGIQSSGTQRLAQAAAFGMSESTFTTLQKNPQQFAQRLQQYTRGLLGETNSPSATESILQAFGFIQGGQNADEVLQEILQGNYTRPTSAGAPPSTAQLNQIVQQETVQAMTVNTLSLPLTTRLGLTGQTLLTGVTDLVNGRPNSPNTQAAAGIVGQAALAGGKVAVAGASAIANPVGAIEHLVHIVISDVAGHVLGGATLQTKGASSQVQTTVPGQGPPANVATRPPSTPNSTNTNGR